MVGFSPILDIVEQAQTVQLVIYQFSHPISAMKISLQFAQGKKTANITREQQIGHLPETICGLGLVKKTEEGLYVR